MLFVAPNGLAISVFMGMRFPGIGESYCSNVSIIMALHSIAKSKFLLAHREKTGDAEPKESEATLQMKPYVL
jgi:hypothetical protein